MTQRSKFTPLQMSVTTPNIKAPKALQPREYLLEWVWYPLTQDSASTSVSSEHPPTKGLPIH